MSRWNDRVQAWLFSRTRLAPTFDPSQVVSPFPFNAFYPAYNVPEIDLRNTACRFPGGSATSAPGAWNDCAGCRRPARSRN
ncbi:putative oxidoreductase, molybdopterin-binding [Pseudomonas aeruginosa]|nr:putative oxidoreductase, molybdopterin-binding [Pseudomonas aeruginosa]